MCGRVCVINGVMLSSVSHAVQRSRRVHELVERVTSFLYHSHGQSDMAGWKCARDRVQLVETS